MHDNRINVSNLRNSTLNLSCLCERNIADHRRDKKQNAAAVVGFTLRKVRAIHTQREKRDHEPKEKPTELSHVG